MFIYIVKEKLSRHKREREVRMREIRERRHGDVTVTSLTLLFHFCFTSLLSPLLPPSLLSCLSSTPPPSSPFPPLSGSLKNG